MSEPRSYLIVLDSATDAHREAVQAIVKAHADRWWHHFADLWIVQGHEVTYWRDLITPTLELSPAKVAVFKLPKRGARAWATAGIPAGGARWLKANLSNKAATDETKP